MEHDTGNYRLSTPNGCIAQLCALCRESIALDPGVYTAAQVEQRIADHHAVCPKRPIAVGDPVIWAFPSRETWAEGDVVSLALKDGKIAYATILVTKHSGNWVGLKRDPAVGEEHRFGCLPEDEISIRRIPRPAAAPKVGDIIPLETGALAVRTAGGDVPITCAPGCQCGAHDQVAGLPPPEPARRVYRPVKVDREAMERAMRDEKLMQRLQDETEKRITWLATSGTKVHMLEPAPPPALIDGLDREACLARWMENRLFSEGHAAPPNVMTRMQIDVGRALWLERYGEQRSAELRERVAADREAERNRVRVDPEVQPWE